jgi:hypothetical protein
MPTKTGFWIRVKNGQVTDVWDYKPSADKLASEPGWREAVEVHPDIVPNREIYTTHHFNIDAEPAQIVWGSREVSVEERQGMLISAQKAAYTAVVNAEAAKEVNDNPDDFYDAAVAAAAKATRDANIVAITAAATHDELDALGL